MPECGICYEEHTKLRILSCKHMLCFGCFEQLRTDSCPYCRQTIIEKREISPQEELEEWLVRDRTEWVTYSMYLRSGRELIYTFHNSDPQPSWRNDDNVTVVKRTRQRKKKRRNRNC